jgi:hypothetical protein
VSRTTVRARVVTLDDLPAPVEPASRPVCQDGGPLVLLGLASRGASGPWAVVDPDRGTTSTARGLTPVADGHLGADGTGVLLTYRGLTPVRVHPRPEVGDSTGAGLGTGRERHEHVLTPLTDEVALVARRRRPSATLVRTASGAVLRRLQAAPPFLPLPAEPGTVRVWALGSGTQVLLDAATWRTVSRRPAPAGLAACRTPEGVVALLGAEDPAFAEPLARTALRDLATALPGRLGALLGRLPSPYRDLRLALLDDDLAERATSVPDLLARLVPDPEEDDGPALTADPAGRAVLTTGAGLAVVDPGALTLQARSRTRSRPAVWPGTSRAVVVSGERELTVLDWAP